MSALGETLSKEQVLDEFDRVMFESIIEKVLIGEINTIMQRCEKEKKK